MRTSQFGDRVRVHYVQTFEDGTVRSSRTGGAPLDVIVGTDHRRLPGLGLNLVGLAEGQRVTLDIPAERAFGAPDPACVRPVARTRFAEDQHLAPGTRTRMRLRGNRCRTVRVVELRGRLVVVDLNHPRCGQSVRVEVELVTILEAAPDGGYWPA